jgi:hypothetical protein
MAPVLSSRCCRCYSPNMTLFVSFTKNTFLGILLRVVISIPPAKGERRARRGGMNDKLHISRFDNLSSFYVRGKKKLHLKRIGRSKNQIGESRPTNISPFMVLQKKTIYPHLRWPPIGGGPLCLSHVRQQRRAEAALPFTHEHHPISNNTNNIGYR